MAYLEHNHTHKRLAGLTGVALVHVVLALGITAGLTIEYIKPKPVPNPGGVLIDLPPPPPTDTPTPQDDRPVIDRQTAPIPPLPIPRPTTVPVDPMPADPPPDTAPSGGTAGGLITLPPPLPDPAPSFIPRGPVPSTSSATWVTTEDYPRIAETREYEGTTGYLLQVDARGRVAGCTVTSSSGHAVLDEAACNRLTRRARFRAATDRNGEAVAGTWRGSVSWQLPE